jgi:oligoendopeptidase F
VPVLMSTGVDVFAQTEELKERSQIPEKYTWNLKDMYASDEAWEADVAAIDGMIPTLKSYEGKISQSPDQLLSFFKVYEDLNKKMDNAGSYASMSYDQDTRQQKYTGFKDRIMSVGVKIGEATAWFTPELVSIPDATFEKWYKEKPELAVYRQFINDQLRTRAHTLSPAEERILALSGNMAVTPVNASTALRNTDIQFPTVKDENGKEVKLSEGRYQMLLESPSRDVRRDAMMGMLGTYMKFQNTAAALMSGNIAKDIFYSTSRKYHSALEASLDNDNVDTTVYLNLIETVHKNIAPLRKYVQVRREAMKLPDIHLYDFNVALIPETRIEVPYDQAVATIEKALAPLGKEYLDPMEKGFASRWIDVYETKGKRSGAYSSGSYLSHPYMLLNYNNTLDDMFTTAHEMGHSMHTWMSMHHQPYIYSDYRIFVAEVASTFNEALLMDYLLKNEKDPAKKLYLVNQYIDNIRGTVISQVMFAEFELKMHQAAEAGQPLTAESLSKMYKETIQSYYGPDVSWDEEYAYTWIRIPHFYRNFYVYKYATSYAASQALSQRVLGNVKGARDAYLHFLSSGSSKYPLDLLRDAGVDMSKPAPIEMTMKKLGELVDQMEKLLIQTGRIPAPKK